MGNKWNLLARKTGESHTRPVKENWAIRHSSLSKAKADICERLEGWYSAHHRHSSLGYKSPVGFEKGI